MGADGRSGRPPDFSARRQGVSAAHRVPAIEMTTAAAAAAAAAADALNFQFVRVVIVVDNQRSIIVVVDMNGTSSM